MQDKQLIDLTPEKFLAEIPATIPENLEFRKALNKLCTESEDARNVMRHLCKQDPRITFKTFYWTFNPKNAPGYRNMPFITWEVQDDMIVSVQDAITDGHDILIDKSRGEGASWLHLGIFLHNWLFIPHSQFLVGSRKIELVDKRGDAKALFWKLDYLLENLPRWLTPESVRTFCHLENKRNGSAIDGESTTENFAAGDRRTAILLDELARVEINVAQGIIDASSDVTDCKIINSTHTTTAHPYCKLRRGITAKIKVFILPWYKDPRFNRGLYQSPDYGQVLIHDIKYWRNAYPGYFDDVHADVPFKTKDIEIDAILSGEERVLFIADGSGKWRSPWYDREVERRSARDVAQNLDMNPVGSGDMVFDAPILQQIRTDLCRTPAHIGEVTYDYKCYMTGPSEIIELSNIKFVPNSGRNRLKWWGELMEDGRPNQHHNYVISGDISLGTGSSNSVASILDVNTNEKVGSWVCAFTSPVNFANQVYALAKWVGGENNPFLIWESNGGQGGAFARQIFKLGYTFYYKKRDEKRSDRPRTQSAGWHSSAQTKSDLLLDYREALSWSFKAGDNSQKFLVYDEDAVGEYEEYIFDTAGRPEPASSAEEEGGARATHGDRVIADALCNLGRREQRVAVFNLPKKEKTNSPKARRLQWETEQSGSINDKRWRE